MMDDVQKLTIDLDDGLWKLVTEMARSRDLTVAAYVVTLIRSGADEDRQFAEFIQAGIDSADRGELLTQEQMEEWFETRHRSVAAE